MSDVYFSQHDRQQGKPYHCDRAHAKSHASHKENLFHTEFLRYASRLRYRGSYLLRNALHSRSYSYTMYRMAKTKVSTLNLRIEPGLKEAVREAAAREHRSVANMVEMLIRRHCDRSGISIPEQSDLFAETSNG